MNICESTYFLHELFLSNYQPAENSLITNYLIISLMSLPIQVNWYIILNIYQVDPLIIHYLIITSSFHAPTIKVTHNA